MFTADTKSNRSNFKYPFNPLIMLNDVLPIIRRKSKIFNYLSVPFKYLWNFYLQFLEYRYQALFITAPTGQTIVLERLLNLLFDPTGRILIVNLASNFQTLYVYRDGEQLPTGEQNFIYRSDETIPMDGVQQYLFRKNEVELNFDFKILIPFDLIVLLNLAQVAAIVDMYKFAGTTYTIEGY